MTELTETLTDRAHWTNQFYFSQNIATREHRNMKAKIVQCINAILLPFFFHHFS